MQSENYKSIENNHNNNSKRDLLLSHISFLKNKHHNLVRALYSLNNCLECSLNIPDPEIDCLSINNDYFSDNKNSSPSDILYEENNRKLNHEEINLFKENPNIVNENIFNIDISSKTKKINHNRTQYFSVIYPEKKLLKKDVNSERDILYNKKISDKSSSKKEKEKKEKRRRDRRDMIRRMIVRTFLNTYIVNKLNKILKKIKCKIYFEKFEKDFAYDFSKKENKKLLNKTLEEIFTSIELYRGEILDKFNHNKQEIKKLESEEYKDIIKETKIDIILNSQIYILYNEYLSSNDFQKEINRLENSPKDYDEEYIEKYKNEAKNFIEYSYK
jgi:hypothetical protein